MDYRKLANYRGHRGWNTVHNVRVGDVIKCRIGEISEHGKSRICLQSCTVTDVYPYFIQAEYCGRQISINYGELVMMGYEKQSLRNQALIASRNRSDSEEACLTM